MLCHLLNLVQRSYACVLHDHRTFHECRDHLGVRGDVVPLYQNLPQSLGRGLLLHLRTPHRHRRPICDDGDACGDDDPIRLCRHANGPIRLCRHADPSDRHALHVQSGRHVLHHACGRHRDVHVRELAKLEHTCLAPLLHTLEIRLLRQLPPLFHPSRLDDDDVYDDACGDDPIRHLPSNLGFRLD